MLGKIDTNFMKRAVLAVCAASVVFALLLGRVLVLQTRGYEKYQSKVVEQLTTRSPSVADRGDIYDSSGRLLATTKTTYRVFISPSAIATAQKALDGKKTSSISELIAKKLSDMIESYR